MLGLTATLGRRTDLKVSGPWLVPAGVARPQVAAFAAALGQFCGAEVITVGWHLCRKAAWPLEKSQRRAVWLVPDGPARALSPATMARLRGLPAAAVVLHGPLGGDAEVARHRALVDAVAAALGEAIADADHPLAHLGVGAAPLTELAALCDTGAELLALVDATATIGIGATPELGEAAEVFWSRMAAQACAEYALDRVAGAPARLRLPVAQAWLARSQSDGTRPERDASVDRQLKRLGLLSGGEAPDGAQWSRLAAVVDRADVRRRMRLQRPEWPWQVSSQQDRVDAAGSRRAVALFAACVAHAGLVPRSDGGLEKLGIAALRQAIDHALEPGDSARGALAPWLDLVQRVGTTASALWRDDDRTRLLHAEPARLRLGEFATTAGAKFAVAALFDALAILVACAEPDGVKAARYWPSLRWTLQRMGAPAAPALAWLRTVVARVAASTSDPQSYANWAQELANAEQDLGGIAVFQPTLRHAQGWLAWGAGDAEAAKKIWIAASAAANRAGEDRQSIEIALDLCLSMLAIGDLDGARRLAKATTTHLTNERDRVRVHWAATVWILASLATDHPMAEEGAADPKHAYALFLSQTSNLENPGANRELVDLGAIVRCAALIAEGRGPEAHTMLAYVLKQARKGQATAWQAAALVAMGYCALWLGDGRSAEGHWRAAVRMLDAPAMVALGQRIAAAANFELGLGLAEPVG